jgi:glycyl-tRNA synthetase
MAFIVKKKVHGKEYYYLNETKRENGKVKSKCLAYFGKDKKEAEKKAKEILSKRDKGKGSEEPIHKKKTLKLISKKISIEDLAIFCKRRGFVYSSGEVYGGFAGFWDFGHLGTELKNNIKKEWWGDHVYQREDMIGIDGAIITHPKVWKASGHVDSFSDVFVVCKKCKKPSKVDRVELGKVKCECGGEYDVESAKDFKLMFEIDVGQGVKSYLRPETAQLMFTNFKFIYDNARMKLPFGIAQIGKAFRNEIAPRDFLFRSREFDQMEIEYFIKESMACPYKIPEVSVLIYSAKDQEQGKEPVKMKIKEALAKKIIKLDWHAYWLGNEFLWFKNLGANPGKFRLRQHGKEELAHYSSDCWDLEYEFPFGWKELEGVADRGVYDLSQHEKISGKDFKIFDEESKQKILAKVVAEPSLGVERAFLVFLLDSYFYDEGRGNIVLKLNPKLAPIKAAIFPIVKKPVYEKLSDTVFKDLSKEWNVVYDKSGSIGRRYARNDEIGTPFCITIDEDSLKNKDVTIRERDTTQQIRVKVSELREILRCLIEGKIRFERAGKPVS